MTKSDKAKRKDAARKASTKKPKPTAEQLSDQQQQALFFAHKRKIKPLIAAAEAAKTALNKAYDLAKSEGVAKKELEIALQLETEEGEVGIRAAHERLVRIARWMGVPIGTQFDFFSTNLPPPHPLFQHAHPTPP